MAMVTGFAVRADVFAVDGLCQDPGASRLSHAAGAAKQKSVRQLSVPDRIFEGGGDVRLADDRRKILGPVFSGADDEFVHFSKPTTNPENPRRPLRRLPIFKKNIGKNLVYLRC